MNVTAWTDFSGCFSSGELLDLCLTIVLQVVGIRRPTDANWTTGVSAHHVAMVRADDGHLVSSGRSLLLRRDEVRADPDSLCAIDEVGS